MKVTELSLPGCHLLKPSLFSDARGSFFKPFTKTVLESHGLQNNFVEQYYSTSGPGVIRGMHFQTPPHDHAKLVYCASGEVCDVLLDLRKGETFGCFTTVQLSASNPVVVYIPAGVAHGFWCVREPGLMIYNVTSEYAPAHDGGISWDSFGYEWPVEKPVMSERDLSFPSLGEFNSPF